MIGSILKIIENISGWFSPEKQDQLKRKRRDEIKKELTSLKKSKWTPELARKVEKLEKELEKINSYLGA